MDLGFLVNPIAGMGGSVGLKGTDGEEILRRAIAVGAKPVANERARLALESLSGGFRFLTCGGEMGARLLKEIGFEGYEVVYEPDKESTALDTRKASSIFLERGARLVLFAGGDGTAQDIYSAIGDRVPMLGIPAGVKMHSAVFAVNAKAAGDIVSDFVAGRTGIREAEILDCDEEQYRQGKLEVKLIGYAQAPYRQGLMQAGKTLYHGTTEEQAKEGIASFAIEFMRDDSLYILGPGSTVKKIASLLGIEYSLLGVDLVKNGELLCKDVGERQILELLQQHAKAKILVSPIGAQGFIFGRGNQQMSPRVLKKVGRENIVVLAAPHKLLETPVLRVDTGDRRLDEELSGEIQVIVGYRLAQRRRVES